MRASESPFPAAWWGVGLEQLGLGVVRPSKGGTYGRYGFRDLPPVPLELGRGLTWLEQAPEQDHHIGLWLDEHQPGKNAAAAAGLPGIAADSGSTLPEPFLTFVATPALHRRIRSSTDCFLDVGRSPVPSPKGGGRLVRFLCDSQGCLFWYLYLTADGSDHCVVASADFYGTDEESEAAANWASDANDPEAIAFCGESFEEFLGRFWLENEACFAGYEKTPLPPAAAEYVRRYRGRQDDLLARQPIRGVGEWDTPAAFVPWPHLRRYVERYDLDRYLSPDAQDGPTMATIRSAYAAAAGPCPDCGRPAADLFCAMVPTPEETWDAGAGMFGLLTVCEACRRQVDFLPDAELTAMQADAWREQRRLA